MNSLKGVAECARGNVCSINQCHVEVDLMACYTLVPCCLKGLGFVLVFLKSGEPGCKYLLRRLAEGDKEFGPIDDNTEEFERVFNEMPCVFGTMKVTKCKGTICYAFTL